MKKHLVAYLRDQGPICYEAQILDVGDRLSLSATTQQLLASRLLWYWESARSYEPIESYKALNLPEERPLTLLTHANASTLVDDISEVDVDGQGRFLAFLGFDPNIATQDLDSMGLRRALDCFVQQEQGPIRIIIIRIGDMRPQYIFVPHYPVEAVGKLLENWGITPTEVEKKRPYKSLNTVKLESVIEAIQIKG